MINQKKIKDGVFFCAMGILLIIYCAFGYSKSFNKDITQSPYLFPFVIALFFIFLSISLAYQGIKLSMPDDKDLNKKYDMKSVIVVLVLSGLYYVFLSIKPLPYITIGFINTSLTIANFEVATLLYLFCMLFYLGVRKIPLLVLVPLVTPIFLSVTFRTMLNVMLP